MQCSVLPSKKVKLESGTAAQEQVKADLQILKEYWDLQEVFRERDSDVVPLHHPTDCSIEILPEAKLSKLKLYSMIPRELDELWPFIDKNLAQSFIQPVKSCMAIPVLFQEKKDGSLHLCMDYHGLNDICMENIYPLPLMKDMLAHLAKGRIFIKLDLREIYYRVCIKGRDE